MAIDSDDLISLPNPPPPRPAARREAIDAALRKFDGIEDPPATRRRPPLFLWASTHRAATGGLVTAALIAVIAAPVSRKWHRKAAPTNGFRRKKMPPGLSRPMRNRPPNPTRLPATPPPKTK